MKRMYNKVKTNEYTVKGYTVYMTVGDQTIILSKGDLNKVTDRRWHLHTWKGSTNKVVCNRFKKDGKWECLTLAARLGYGHGYIHKNGNVYDFRKKNMVKNESYKLLPNYIKSHQLDI